MINQEKLDTILTRYEASSANLIPVLQDIQDEFNYLPKDELKVVAGRLQVPLTQVYSVATFFKMFSLEPKGRHQVRVCLGTACHLRGGQRWWRRFPAAWAWSRAVPPRTCNSPWKRWAASAPAPRRP